VRVVRSPEELSARFRAMGLNVTPQRQCIFRVLHGNESHPTAEAVYAAVAGEMPTISLKTVYQTLNDLAGLGEIALLDLGTGAARFDPNVDGDHHHLVCDRCGKVRDLHADLGPFEVPDDQRQGFTLGRPEIVFRGLCQECAGAAAGAPGHVPRPPHHQHHHKEHHG
jgi:Fur family transcriptional regulator, stress-responsive regulator